MLSTDLEEQFFQRGIQLAPQARSITALDQDASLESLQRILSKRAVRRIRTSLFLVRV